MTTGTAGASTSSSTIAAQAATTAVKSGARKLLYLGGGGTAVGAAAIAAVILTSGGAEAVQIAGQYGYESRIVSADNASAAPGSVFETATWTLPECKAPCSGTIVPSSGQPRNFTFDGNVLAIHRVVQFTEPCSAGGTSDDTLTSDTSLRPDRTAGAVQRWTGVENQTIAAIRVPPGCVIGPPKRATLSITLTRRG